MMRPDEICVSGLELRARIGAGEAERTTPQRLTVTLAIQPARSFDDLHEHLERTVDYSAVCREVRNFAGEGSWRLLETLTVEIAERVLALFDCVAVTVELRKYILADTEYVAARAVRSRPRP